MYIIKSPKILLFTIALSLTITACEPASIDLNPPPTPTLTPTPFVDSAHNQMLARLSDVLTETGKPAQDLLFACLMNYDQQSIPLSVARDKCVTEVLEADDKGFGGPFGDIGNEDIFDPGTITAKCSSGDPTRAESLSDLITHAHETFALYKEMDAAWQNAMNKAIEARDAGDSDAFNAALEEVNHWANRAKKEAGRVFIANAALQGALASGPSSSSSSASSSGSSASSGSSSSSSASSSSSSSSSSSASSRSSASSNSSSSAVAAGSDSACEQALQEAREFLYECHRTEWQSYECQQLLAKMNNCPDPALILVDPDQGYACGSKSDAETLEALKNAWVERCETRKRFDPSGQNPCRPPQFDESLRTGNGPMGDICNDPAAYIDPDNNDCIATFEVRPFGEVNLQQIAVWGLNKLGGPIVVFPPRGNDTPSPGPDPKPIQ